MVYEYYESNKNLLEGMFLNFSSGIYLAGWFHDNTLDFYFGCAWVLSKPRH